jgi:hypothetical protein
MVVSVLLFAAVIVFGFISIGLPSTPGPEPTTASPPASTTQREVQRSPQIRVSTGSLARAAADRDSFYVSTRPTDGQRQVVLNVGRTVSALTGLVRSVGDAACTWLAPQTQALHLDSGQHARLRIPAIDGRYIRLTVRSANADPASCLISDLGLADESSAIPSFSGGPSSAASFRSLSGPMPKSSPPFTPPGRTSSPPESTASDDCQQILDLALLTLDSC